MRRIWAAALCAAGLLVVSGQAAAEVLTFNFTIEPGLWDDSSTPFGIDLSAPITGSFTVDTSTTDATAFTALNLTAGDQTWSVSDIRSASTIVLGEGGGIYGFEIFTSDALIAAAGTTLLGTADFSDGDSVNSCNECLSVPGLAAVQLNAPLPEPSTWAMLIAGAYVVGAAIRRNRAIAVRS